MSYIPVLADPRSRSNRNSGDRVDYNQNDFEALAC